MMKRLLSCLVLLTAAAICLSAGGCAASNASTSWPRVLHYAFSPQADQLQSGVLHTQQVRQYLQSQLHIPVDLVQVDQYAATIEAMRANKLDIAHFGALAYIIAVQKAGAQAIVSRGYPDGRLGGYRSLIAVPKDSPIHSMQDLKARARSVVFAFADPASTSGNLYPRVGLQSTGIDPERDFKQVLYANGHLAALMATLSGKVDAGAFDEAYMARLIAKGKMKPGDVRIIWTSSLIPSEPIAVRGSLPEQLKKEIQVAYLDMRTKDPALWNELSQTVYSATPGTTYIPVTDATYDGLRHYALQVKQFNFLEK
jgi:phosphonate transport system substrate-binding protein